ncbi:S-adenosyl-L-methionine-dependent methyltransferase [Gigaspora margarita]|uniref:S-adenosyl-L-methionine-dependent methyltransferase n=1 Tax=Gigaspora margarita TaxID=4874 RepID=A0A8H3X2G1_GIGMA|nr:S-adenosyl-L-methionine-dependent methyltransferase [Gigaspora margarita]
MNTLLYFSCGPGTWLLEMSTTYPQSQFYGIDIAHAFPKEIKPGNLEFIQSDITNGIKFDDDYFDFVRMSLLATFLQEDKWVRVLRELIRVLKPGGYIEIIEHELQYNIGPCFSTLVTPLLNFIRSTGANIQIVQKIDSLLTTSSSSNHHISPSSQNGVSTLHSTNTLTNTSSHQINQNLSNALSKLTNTHSDTRTVLIGSAHGGQTGKVFEELLKSYFENTVVDLLPWYMEISKEKYLELWKSCHKEFKNRASSTKLHKFWGMKIGQ